MPAREGWARITIDEGGGSSHGQGRPEEQEGEDLEGHLRQEQAEGSEKGGARGKARGKARQEGLQVT